MFVCAGCDGDVCDGIGNIDVIELRVCVFVYNGSVCVLVYNGSVDALGEVTMVTVELISCLMKLESFKISMSVSDIDPMGGNGGGRGEGE